MNEFLIMGIVQLFFLGTIALGYQVGSMQTCADANIKKLSRYLSKKSFSLLTFVSHFQIKCYLTGKFQLIAWGNFAFNLLIFSSTLSWPLRKHGYGLTAMAIFIFCSNFMAGIFKFIYLRKNRSKISFDFHAINTIFDDLLDYQLTISPFLNERLNVHLHNLAYNCKSLAVQKRSRRRKLLFAISAVFDVYAQIAAEVNGKQPLNLGEVPIFTKGDKKITLTQMLELFASHFSTNESQLNIESTVQRFLQSKLVQQELLSNQLVRPLAKLTSRGKINSLLRFFIIAAIFSLISFAFSGTASLLMNRYFNGHSFYGVILLQSVLILFFVFINKVVLTKLTMLKAKCPWIFIMELLFTTLVNSTLVGLWFFCGNKLNTNLELSRLAVMFVVSFASLVTTGIYSLIRNFSSLNEVRKHLNFVNLVATLIFGTAIGLLMYFIGPLAGNYNILNLIYPIFGGFLLWLMNAILFWYFDRFKQKHDSYGLHYQLGSIVPVPGIALLVKSTDLFTLMNVDSLNFQSTNLSNKKIK